MLLGSNWGRGSVAIATLLAFVCSIVMAQAAAASSEDGEQALALLNDNSCGAPAAESHGAQAVASRAALPATQHDASPATSPNDGSPLVAQFVPPEATPTPSPSGSATPAPYATPTFPAPPGFAKTLVATPRPQGSPSASPPPIPTPTPGLDQANAPVFLVRGGSTPPPITPAGQIGPSPTPQPIGVPTLAPNYVAIISDTVEGNTNDGKPGDAIGNVHIYYQQEEIVGDRAHYDGIRTVTVTGHPFIVDHGQDSVLTADTITFDVIDQTAKLVNARGVSSQGIEKGLIHYKSSDMHTDADGTAHGIDPYLTTCENARAGYHITGKKMDVIPGDKIVIYKAILWLGAAAVFYLPKVVIPLRTVSVERRKTSYFPDVGYDQYEGFWVKTTISFGKDQYYYGYYIINYFTKVGLGLGYVGFYSKKNGRRSASLNFYGIRDRRTSTTTYNFAATEQENFSQTLRSNFGFTYQSNYGSLTNVPPNESLSAMVVHQTQKASQNYTFSHSSVGTQSSATTFAFSDTQQFNQALSEALNFSFSSNQSSFGGFNESTSSSNVNSLTHLTTKGADYQLVYNKTYTQTPFGDDTIPELQIRPYDFFQHFIFPLSAQFTIGQYSEPTNRLSTSRADLAFVLGPVLAKVFGSDLQASANVQQYAYGTGDLKASIQQVWSLTTPIGNHFVNAITYNEANYNGPPFVPFQFMDQQPSQNVKNAQDLVRLFNGDTYALALGFATNFDALAQPVSYQLSLRPSRRSVVLLSGAFVPGPGAGFYSTNVQFATPFGYETQLQMATDVDWKAHFQLQNKVIYYTKTIGECYQLQALYNQSQQLVTVSINLLALPSQAASFALGQGGSIVPQSFNF